MLNVGVYGVDDGKKRKFIKSVVNEGVVVQSNGNVVICFEQCLRHIIICIKIMIILHVGIETKLRQNWVDE